MISPTYRLETFEGPLDLLLTLIERYKIDIYDIEISLLLEQYLAWMEQAKEQNLEITADFLEMASQLVYIKSCSLLPKPETEEKEDPKLLLEQMLLEYAKYKRAAGSLRTFYKGDQIFFREDFLSDLPKPKFEPQAKAEVLKATYLRLIRRHRQQTNPPKDLFTEIVSTKIISVSTKILTVLRILVRKSTAPFKDFFRGAESRSAVVATFLALLELMHSGRIRVTDAQEMDNPQIELVRHPFKEVSK